MADHPIRLGTRASPLALVQTQLAQQAIVAARPEMENHLEVRVFDTRGDQHRDCLIDDIGGRGVFTDELDQAVVQGHIDFAIHSVKDLPVPLVSGLVLAATLPRADPREAFVSTRHASLAAVPPGGTLGSASLRREALVKTLRPDLDFALLRGNVEERLVALDRRGLDGTILAVAGLARLGLQRHIREILSPDTLMPDPGQGAIGLICRADNLIARGLAARVNHAATLSAVTAERAFLAAAGGRFVVGALAQVSGPTLTLSASAALPHGSVIWRQTIQGPAETPAAVAQKLAVALPAVAAQGERA